MKGMIEVCEEEPCTKEEVEEVPQHALCLNFFQGIGMESGRARTPGQGMDTQI